MSKLKVGYVPYAPGCDGPGDRRRFCFYARSRGIDFEIASPDRHYDLVVLGIAADLSIWSHRPKNTRRILFDLPDSYLASGSSLAEAVKGPAKYVTGKWRRFEPSFLGAVRRMCAASNAIACSTPEQRDALGLLNSRTRDVLDCYQGDVVNDKTSYTPSAPFRLVWEGVGNSLYGLQALAGVLQSLQKRLPIELHLLTDLRFRRMNSPFGGRCARAEVNRILPNVRTYLYEWNQAFFSEIATRCDLAIIPVEVSIPMVCAKPENRLLLFWTMGLPTITSSTPAYTRVMRAAEVGADCRDLQKWSDMLTDYCQDQSLRERNVRQGRRYIADRCSREELLRRWDELFHLALEGS